MISEKKKEKLLKEVEKLGIVYTACLRVGINPSTYYRWKKKNKKFRAKAEEAEEIGGNNSCDMAEYTVMKNVKKGDEKASEFVLVHRSKKYKSKRFSDATIRYKKDIPPPTEQPKTFEDLLDDHRKDVHEYGLELHKRFTQFGGEIPTKPDGSPIEIDELSSYERYIEDWQRQQRREKEQEKFRKSKASATTTEADKSINNEQVSIDTEDSKSLKDKPEANPLENHKAPDISH